MTKFASLFQNGRSQAVRLPKEFRFSGERVKISLAPGGGVLLQPEKPEKIDVQALFRKLDKYKDLPFMEEGRDQPPMPPDKDLFD
jgi:antitoxin VapB